MNIKTALWFTFIAVWILGINAQTVKEKVKYIKMKCLKRMYEIYFDVLIEFIVCTGKVGYREQR